MAAKGHDIQFGFSCEPWSNSEHDSGRVGSAPYCQALGSLQREGLNRPFLLRVLSVEIWKERRSNNVAKRST